MSFRSSKGMKLHPERINFGLKEVHFCASGIARGSGWQHIGAYVNLGAFSLVGIPSAVVLGFVVHLKAKGLWIGIVISSVLQSTILSLVTAFTNWQIQVSFDILSSIHVKQISDCRCLNLGEM